MDKEEAYGEVSISPCGKAGHHGPSEQGSALQEDAMVGPPLPTLNCSGDSFCEESNEVGRDGLERGFITG